MTGLPQRPTTVVERRCGCEPDLDDEHFARECDYCGTAWAGVRCVHDAFQDPCPECDVLPAVQLG